MMRSKEIAVKSYSHLFFIFILDETAFKINDTFTLITAIMRSCTFFTIVLLTKMNKKNADNSSNVLRCKVALALLVQRKLRNCKHSYSSWYMYN